jgi:hypothetical protein
VVRAEIDGHTVVPSFDLSDTDQHVAVRVPLKHNTTTVRIHLHNEFGLTQPLAFPILGAQSTGVRVISESWNSQRDTLSLDLQGMANHEYKFLVSEADQIADVQGAELHRAGQKTELLIKFPPGATSTYFSTKIILHFKKDLRNSKNRK